MKRIDDFQQNQGNRDMRHADIICFDFMRNGIIGITVFAKVCICVLWHISILQ